MNILSCILLKPFVYIKHSNHILHIQTKKLSGVGDWYDKCLYQIQSSIIYVSEQTIRKLLLEHINLLLSDMYVNIAYLIYMQVLTSFSNSSSIILYILYTFIKSASQILNVKVQEVHYLFSPSTLIPTILCCHKIFLKKWSENAYFLQIQIISVQMLEPDKYRSESQLCHQLYVLLNKLTF